MQGYDIIGDIHGCATKLEALLGDLGYQCDPSTGVHSHPDRCVIFVGDLIDRGPEQARVLEIVKGMVEAGAAQIVMGNHEFNAVCYATENPSGSGEYLRSHSEKNAHQHEAFLTQVDDEMRSRYVAWFTTLPLWLDLGGLRVVHACWHQPSIDAVERHIGLNRLSATEHFVRASTKGDPVYDAVEVLLKGPEVSLVDYRQPPYKDKDGHVRGKARVRWWNADAVTLRDIAVMEGNFTTEDGSPYPELPDVEVHPDARSYVYTGSVPVFYGHYWRQGEPKPDLDWTSHSACVDFSAVKGGKLFAYRWSGEQQLRADNFVSAA